MSNIEYKLCYCMFVYSTTKEIGDTTRYGKRLKLGCTTIAPGHSD